MSSTPNYTELTRVYTRLYRYYHLSSIVGWDRNAMMPPSGNEARAAAEAELSALIHRTRTDPQLKGWLNGAEREELDEVARANLREIRRDWRDANALPESLVEAKTLAGARCEHAWRSQRPANDWKGFLENFRPVVKLARQEAQLLADDSGLAPYDALMDRFEPGVRAADIDRIFTTFPRLKERRTQLAGTLSGGEQQMLAMGRALMAQPTLLLLDEPSMGLSPLMVDKIFEVIQGVAAQGMTILLVEQNARRALQIADRAYVMESGLITLSGAAKNLLNDPKVRAAYLGE